jgi:hypothetical protein
VTPVYVPPPTKPPAAVPSPTPPGYGGFDNGRKQYNNNYNNVYYTNNNNNKNGGGRGRVPCDDEDDDCHEENVGAGAGSGEGPVDRHDDNKGQRRPPPYGVDSRHMARPHGGNNVDEDGNEAWYNTALTFETLVPLFTAKGASTRKGIIERATIGLALV